MRLVFATHNEGKVKEVQAMFADLSVKVVTADEAGVHEDPAEDGATFEENALKKARFVGERTGEWAVADDSGICIDALYGAPGVKTARWAGEGKGGEALVKKALDSLQGVPFEKRTAHFECAVALVAPDGPYWIFRGTVHGRVAESPRGTWIPELPFDVLFIPDGYESTYGEIPVEEKNHISHRGRAFAKLKDFLRTQSPVLMFSNSRE